VRDGDADVTTLDTLLAQDTHDIKVDYNGHAILVTYDAAALTPELEARIRAAGDEGTREVADMVVALVHGWDLEETEGVPLPITSESASRLPVKFLAVVVAGITKDLVGDPLLNATSDAT